MNSLKDAISTLAAGPLFKGIDPALLLPMTDALTEEHWSRRHFILNPHQAAKHFHVILNGRVKIFLHSQGGRELTLSLLGPGDAFHLESLLDGQEPGVFVQALDDVDALSGPTELWKNWLDTNPAFRCTFRRYVDRRLRDMTELAGDLALHDTMSRLAHLLLRYFNGIEGPNLIEDLSHEELANMIGTVRIVINRLFAELKREGIVDTNAGKLRVLDLQKLLNKAEHHAIGLPSEA